MSGITLLIQDTRWRTHRGLQARLKTAAEAARKAGKLKGDFTILLTNDKALRALNRAFRGKDKPTNVLSFNGAGAMPDGRYFLGELVICAPVVAREALTQGKTLESHWAHMTVHGVLHLLGFDHERRGEAAKMEAREIQMLDRLGFLDPYR